MKEFPKVCSCCGTDFIGASSRSEFCNNADCQKERKEKRKRLIKSYNKSSIAVKNCVACGVSIKPRDTRQKFCSSICCKKNHNKTEKAKKTRGKWYKKSNDKRHKSKDEYYSKNREDGIAKSTYRKSIGSTKGVSEKEIMVFYLASAFKCDRENENVIKRRIEYAKTRELFRK